MRKADEHVLIPTLKRQLADHLIDRREFLRYAALLGMSATAAHAFVRKVTGEPFVATAAAQSLPKGGTLRLGMRCQDLKSPHTYSWIESANVTRQVLDYLAVTGIDNVTRPGLIEKWEPSPDLKTWTLRVRKNVKWHNGRQFTADDVVWNLKRVLDAKTGSSTVGAMKSFMLDEFETGEKDDKGNPKMTTELWDASAIEKKDDHTIILHGQSGMLAMPENLFHYPALILHPKDEGKWGVGAIGSGAYEPTEIEVGKKVVVKRRGSYWKEGGYLDEIHFVDLGDDQATKLAALASKQVDGLYDADLKIYESIKKIPGIEIHSITTAQTGVARMKVGAEPFKDPKVRKAMKLAIDSPTILKIAYRDLGAPGDHHHVCPVHPDYAEVPVMKRDVEAAKKLLADAGHPDGIEVELHCKKDPDWEPSACQAMVEQWAEAGIKVKLNVMPGAQYWDVWTKVPFGFTTWAHRPLGTMVLGLAYRTGAAWNEAAWSNAEFDKLITEAEGYLDVAKRREVMAKLEQIMLDDGPAVVPVWRAVFNYTDKKIKGYKIHPTIYIEAKDMWIDA